MPATMHYSETRKQSTTDLPLRDHIKEVMNNYYKNMAEQGATPENVYELIMSEAELPLIEATMEYSSNNQSTAASVLGLNRGTFRKKLSFYGML
jgi:Fis family transcriptional regulator